MTGIFICSLNPITPAGLSGLARHKIIYSVVTTNSLNIFLTGQLNSFIILAIELHLFLDKRKEVSVTYQRLQKIKKRNKVGVVNGDNFKWSEIEDEG